MPSWSLIVRNLAGAAALMTVVACSEATPSPASSPALVTTTPSTVASAPHLDLGFEGPKPVAVVAPSTAAPIDADTASPRKDARDALAHGELDRALRLARLAATKSPDRASAWNTLGRVQLRRGERAAATESFQQAVELDPGSAWAQNNYGLVLLYAGRYDEAIAAFEEATDLSPTTGLMWNNLGMAYEHVDRLEEARIVYKRAMNLEHAGATQNFVRLEGIHSLRRTAKVDVTVDEDQTAIEDGL